eukprot:TRINITY_DN1354_c0_g1_i3.p1 TRINITY_DN1354_c0_g1~~TRINITY_DN1354_c0_g1_i3.p1  ORF type:complete len:1547 (+),score=372.19 TRINITY_DN1354_c0_g1_i3:61-4701(+)
MPGKTVCQPAGRILAVLCAVLCLCGGYSSCTGIGAPDEKKLCHHDHIQCLYGISPDFGDAVQLRIKGMTGEIMSDKGLHEAFCNRDNWHKKNEICGRCLFTLRIERVDYKADNPARQFFEQPGSGGLESFPICLSQVCLGDNLNTYSSDIISDIGQSGMELVTHKGLGCNESDWEHVKLPGKIAVYTYHTNADREMCSESGQHEVATKLGAKIGIVMADLSIRKYENRPPVLFRGGGAGTALFFAFYDNIPVVEWLQSSNLRDASSLISKMTGRVEHDATCEAGDIPPVPTDHPDFFNNTCPFWFLPALDMCSSRPVEQDRLCSYCAMTVRAPEQALPPTPGVSQTDAPPPAPTQEPPCRNDSAENGGDDVVMDPTNLGCIYAPDINPLRRSNTLFSLFQEGEGSITVPVIYYGPNSGVPSQLCDPTFTREEAGRQKWDPKSTVLLWDTDSGGWEPQCHRVQALRNLQGYVRAVVVLTEQIIAGYTGGLSLPMGITQGTHHMQNIISYVTTHGTYDNITEVYSANLTFVLGSAEDPSEVQRDPSSQTLPVVDKVDRGVLEEDGSIASLVLIPILLTAVVGKVYLDAKGSVADRQAIQVTPDVDAAAVDVPGLPLVWSSTALSLSLLVTVAALSFGLSYDAGQRGVADASHDGEQSVEFTNNRNLENVQMMARVYMQTVTDSAISAFHKWKTKALYQTDMLENFFTSDNETTTWDVFWKEQVPGFRTATMKGHKFEEAWPDMVWTVQVYKTGGFYIDDSNVTNDYLQRAVVDGVSQNISESDNGYHYNYMELGKSTEKSIPRDAWNPFERIRNSELPPGYCDVLTYFKHNDNGYRNLLGFLYYASYNEESGLETFRGDGPMLSILWPIRSIPDPNDLVSHNTLNGLIVMSRQAKQLSLEIMDSLSSHMNRNPLSENMSMAFFDNDGIMFATSGEAYRTVDYFPGRRQGSELPTVYSTRMTEVVALAEYLKMKFGTLVPDLSDKGTALHLEFDESEYYKQHVTPQLIYASFDDGVQDDGTEAWDLVFKGCPGEGVCNGVFAPGREGAGGKSLVFRGESQLLILPYLTTRVPRVQQTRVLASSGWRSTKKYYSRVNDTGYGNITGVVVAPESYTKVDKLDAVIRERFQQRSFTVMMWVFREPTISEDAQLFTDRTSGSAAIRMYASGVLELAVGSHGCFANASSHLNNSAWFHIAASVDFGARTCSVLVNGVRVARGDISRVMIHLEYSESYVVGHKFDGMIDDFRVFNHSLDAEAVTSVRSGGTAVPVPSKNWTASVVVREEVDGLNATVHAILIPSEDITRNVTENSRRINEIMAISRQNTESQFARKSVETVLVTCVIFLVATLVFLIFNEMLTKPFAVLAQDINQVAMMNVDEIDVDWPKSILREVNVMNRATKVLIKNMRAYKSFMPTLKLQFLYFIGRAGSSGGQGGGVRGLVLFPEPTRFASLPLPPLPCRLCTQRNAPPHSRHLRVCVCEATRRQHDAHRLQIPQPLRWGLLPGEPDLQEEWEGASQPRGEQGCYIRPAALAEPRVGFRVPERCDMHGPHG